MNCSNPLLICALLRKAAYCSKNEVSPHRMCGRLCAKQTKLYSDLWCSSADHKMIIIYTLLNFICLSLFLKKEKISKLTSKPQRYWSRNLLGLTSNLGISTCAFLFSPNGENPCNSILLWLQQIQSRSVISLPKDWIVMSSFILKDMLSNRMSSIWDQKTSFVLPC